MQDVSELFLMAHQDENKIICYNEISRTVLSKIPYTTEILKSSINQSMLYYSVGQNVTEYIAKV